jgi:hypothetical protein
LLALLRTAILGVSMDDKNEPETFMFHSTVLYWK